MTISDRGRLKLYVEYFESCVGFVGDLLGVGLGLDSVFVPVATKVNPMAQSVLPLHAVLHRHNSSMEASSFTV